MSASHISTFLNALHASKPNPRRFSRFLYQQNASNGVLHDEALRILYCGSDSFSCTSLQALYQEYQRPSSNIASIDVVCREGKPYGRGLKSVRHPEIKDVASSLGLPVHQIQTFTGWKPPEYPNSSVPKVNLIIAVSFGLFIPQRILSSAKFSGINLHPSLLPEYKGPAPLHWTILNGDTKTGMTLQTLHPTSFDEGVILDQTPWPGIDVPEDCDYPALLEIMKPLGADMLVRAIRERLYLPPHHNVGWAENKAEDAALRKNGLFPNIENVKSVRIHMGIYCGSNGDTAGEDMNPNGNGIVPEVLPGLPYWQLDVSKERKGPRDLPMLVNTIDGQAVSVDSMKVEGDVNLPALRSAQKHRLIGPPRYINSKRLVAFHNVLTAR